MPVKYAVIVNGTGSQSHCKSIIKMEMPIIIIWKIYWLFVGTAMLKQKHLVEKIKAKVQEKVGTSNISHCNSVSKSAVLKKPKPTVQIGSMA